MDQRYSDNDPNKRDVPSFIEPLPPLITNPFMRPRPQKGTNLLELFEKDSDCDEPELVQVYLRLKPCNIPSHLYEVKSDRHLITSLDTATAGHGRRTQHNVSKMYTFTHIFGPESDQKEIFENVVKENLKKLPEGHNYTLLTYGASGSGKTYTLMGTVAAPGLVPRSLEYVFRIVDAATRPLYKPAESGADKLSYHEQEYELQLIKNLKKVSAPLRDKYRRMSTRLCNDMTVSHLDLSNRTRYYVWVSFVEIYNEGIYDLLGPGDRRHASKLRIREDAQGHVFVQGATQAFVRSGEEAYDVMVAGKHKLQVAATGVHAHSSRSHSIFTITMLTDNESGVMTSYVRLCDLAGCERARKTRNLGARMQESRAINSSLHVLERCLHVLRRRRKQQIVPYRESKLTRLLGAGLSGASGESVSVVVALNPAPEYALETRHVLQLAAVAKDIQLYNTMLTTETTFETTQDTTLETSAEVMHLRAENERLHFELRQALSHNRELRAAMEKKQHEVTNTMRELVEEAKDITREYYESQLQELRTEMEELKEEYESRLEEALQNKDTQLQSARIAILEEDLIAERLARAGAEEEVQHLRACIEERDEKDQEDVVLLTDSDNESDEETNDPCNESLEPTFKKEDINRTRQRLSMLNSCRNNERTLESIGNIHEKSENESDFDKSEDTLQDACDKMPTSSNSSANDSNNEISKEIEDNQNQVKDNDLENHYYNVSNTVKKSNHFRGTYFVKDDKTDYKFNANNENSEVDKTNTNCRGTYFVPKSIIHSNDQHSANIIDSVDVDKIDEKKPETLVNKIIESTKDTPGSDNSLTQFEQLEKAANDYRQSMIDRSANLLPDVPENMTSDNKHDTETCVTVNIKNIEEKTKDKLSETLVNKIIESTKIKRGSDNSLTQFEQFEIAANDYKQSRKENSTEWFSNINILKEKRKYFDDELKEEVCNDVNNANEKVLNHETSERIKDFCTETVNKSKYFNDDLKTASCVDDNMKEVTNDNIISKLNHNLNNDLQKIEELASKDRTLNKEMANLSIGGKNFEETHDVDNNQKDIPKYFEDKPIYKEKSVIHEKELTTEIILSKSKDVYFHDILENKDVSTNVNDCIKAPKTASKVSKEKTSYFDNLGVAESEPNSKQFLEFHKDLNTDATRSPSIVKDDSLNDFEPASIKKYLSKTCVKKCNVTAPKFKTISKHDSLDIFDGLDSPQIEIKKNIEKKETYDTDVINDNTTITHNNSVRKIISEPKHQENDTEVLSEISKPSVKDLTVLNNTEMKPTESQTSIIQGDNTIEDFENIYKDITAPRATEFELLISQDDINMQENSKIVSQESFESHEMTKYSLRGKEVKTEVKKPPTKYNLRMKSEVKKQKDKKIDFEEDVLAESYSKCEKETTKRSLRLRRRKNQSDEEEVDQDKLKDIVNLQKEFSDVTMDIPAPKKDVADIPSPEKVAGQEENLPPSELLSCPSKSVTRSRRKLFTPRAEPLDESSGQVGDSNERIYVPRPSYHRVRARRKLN